MDKKWKLIVASWIFVSFLLFFSISAFCIAPPDPDEMEKYKQDGTFPARLEFAKKLGCYKFHPDLVNRKITRMKKGVSFEQLPYSTGLPSSGNPKILVFLVEFPDYPHVNDVATFTDKLFGDGDLAEYPYESLTAYYQRSSYGALNISGDVYGWYTAQHNRKYYGTTYNKVKELIKEVFDHYNATVDFSQYDNNGDGKIDYFCIFWTGPDKGWGSIWWAWNDLEGEFFKNDPYSVDGKTLGVFTWAWESRPVGSTFSPHTMIHETGHALGLPDYYDYDDTKGPDGGVGGLDMMDANWGDHNAFSKWMLEWLTPTVMGTIGTSQNLSFLPTSSSPEALVIMPSADVSKPFSEYFIVQSRYRTGNDKEIPTDGFLIWHVDATLNDAGDNFKYDNSYTEHKLLRLMEADGLEEIEQKKKADAGDFYTPGDIFSDTSTPNSRSYTNSFTGVIVQNIIQNDQIMSGNFSIEVEVLQPPSAPSNLLAFIKNGKVLLTWSDNSNNEDGFKIERKIKGGSYTQIGTVGSDTTMYVDTKITAGNTYYYRVKAYNEVGDSGYSNEATPQPCFIATASFGSPLAKQIDILRDFRDMFLMNNILGKSFIRWYYKYGQIAATFINRYPTLKTITRIHLYPIIAFAFLSVHNLLLPLIFLLFSIYFLVKLKTDY